MSEEKKEQGEQCEKKECRCKIVKIVLLIVLAYTFIISTYMAVKLGVFDPRAPINQPQGQANQNFMISQKYDKGQSLEKAKETGKPMVVWFYVDWCGYCKRFAPVFAKVTKSGAFKKNLAVAYVNCDMSENHDLMQEYKIDSYPTVFVVNPDGTKVQIPNGKLFAPDAAQNLIKEFLAAAGVGK